MTHSDRLCMRGLEVDCIIGFIEWERRVRQTVVIDIDVPVDCRRSARTDQVADALDYQQVTTQVVRFVSGSQFNLLETLAERIAALILAEFGVADVRVGVKKIGSMPGLREAEVRIERTAADLAASR